MPNANPQSSKAEQTLHYDAVVIGAGVAGLSFSLRLPEGYRIALITKGNLGESNTRYAQGGISAAVGPDDSPRLHEEDTLVAGAGLCDVDAVRTLVDGAPEAVDWLVSIGAQFDVDGSGNIELGKEAAHSRHRVLHAGGDATGAEVERAMVAAIRQRSDVDIFENTFAIDLVAENCVCRGVLCKIPGQTGTVRLEAPVVVLAAGGAGQVWAVTSNPPGATADGLAMAIRAGVAIADLEFVQFHPTVLAVPGTESFLVTEAVRGEGAYLRDSDGRRFMAEIHPLAELAPRDVVARGIQSTMASTGTQQVYLDLRHLNGEAMIARFPTISRELRRRGLSLDDDLIPVAPAAHYFIGGVAASSTGLSSMPGLYALGEAACSGVHGANRLASNSLLEGLVFGKAAAEHVASSIMPGGENSGRLPAEREAAEEAPENSGDVRAAVDAIRDLMSSDVAVVRDKDGLRSAVTRLEATNAQLAEMETSTALWWQARNIGQAALAITQSALYREESRGAHFRRDVPDTNPDLDGEHTMYDPAAQTWRFGHLDDAVAQSGTSATAARRC